MSDSQASAIHPTRASSVSPFGPIAVIVDPSAGRGIVGTKLATVGDALAASGLEHTLAVADTAVGVESLARSAFEAGTRFVVAVGDDGTVQDVVNGAFRDGTTIVDQPVIGVIAAGTGCDLVRSFGLPDDLDGAVTHLRGETAYALDVMKVSVAGDHRREGEGRRTVYGHNVAQVGFRAAVAARAARRGGGRGRRFLAFWSTYLRWRARELTLHVDARTHELRPWDVTIGNGQFVDDGMRLSPRSYPGDGVLDALAFVGPKADAYRMLPRIFMNGGHLPDPGVKEFRAKIRVAVESERPLPVVLDGRAIGSTPVTVQIVPQQVLLKL